MPWLLHKRRGAACAFAHLGGATLALHSRLWRGLLVLNYHRIGRAEGSPFDWGLWSADQDEFDDQVQYLRQHFDLVSPGDLDEVLRSRRGRHVMITFDDGYRDNYELALPVLQAHSAPAAFFLSTGFLDRPSVSWWDEIAWMVRRTTRLRLAPCAWHAQPIAIDPPAPQAAISRLLRIYKTLPGDQTADYLEHLATATGSGRCPADLAADTWMTWDMVREMRAAGMTLGGHTVSHPILARLPRDRQFDEIAVSRRRIEAETGQAVHAFSYPVGGADSRNDDTRECLEKLGFRWAFRYGQGYQPFERCDRFEIPRVAVERDLTPAEFRSLTSLPQVFA